jgi:hypothetical protein
VTESQVIYKNQTVQIELEPETIVQTQTIIIDASPETKVVTVKGDKDQKGLLILLVVISIFVLLASILCIRYFLTKASQDKLDIELKIQRTKQEIEIKPAPSDQEKKGVKSY